MCFIICGLDVQSSLIRSVAFDSVSFCMLVPVMAHSAILSGEPGEVFETNQAQYVGNVSLLE